MTTVNVTYHEKAGVQNTEATLEAVKQRASVLGIKQLVTATTTGQMALTCAETFPEMETIVGVMMHAVDQEIFVQRPEGKIRAPHPDIVDKARAKGVKIYRGTHSLMGALSSALQQKFGGWSSEALVSAAYMSISTGTKVAVESVLMAADAGYLEMQSDVIAMGGWRGGVDTAVVIKPAYSHSFFDLRIREFIAMPRDGGA